MSFEPVRADGRFDGGRLLIVDDEEANIRLLERILEPSGFGEIRSTTDPRELEPLVGSFEPDLVLLDWLMPHMDGEEALRILARIVPDEAYLPVLVLTSDHSADVKRTALSAGAHDFLIKPLSPAEVRLRVSNLLQTRFLHLQLEEHNQHLEERVRERTRELEEARIETLERLARATEYRDDETGEHTQRVGRAAAFLAARIGLPADEVEVIRQAAPLHDVGKIAVPDAILLKPGELSDEEYGLMKRHTVIGAEILSESRFPILQCASVIARTHHERWDGEGYPDGLAGEEIPLPGRIVAVADTFDAITHPRKYKGPESVDEALAEIGREGGHQFDPAIAEAFVSAREDLGTIREVA